MMTIFQDIGRWMMPRLMAYKSNQNVISMFTPSHQCSCAHVCVSKRIHKHTYVKQKSSTSNLGILNLAYLFWIFRRGVENEGGNIYSYFILHVNFTINWWNITRTNLYLVSFTETNNLWELEIVWKLRHPSSTFRRHQEHHWW